MYSFKIKKSNNKKMFTSSTPPLVKLGTLVSRFSMKTLMLAGNRGCGACGSK